MAYEYSDVEKNGGVLNTAGSNTSGEYEKRNGHLVTEDGAVPGESFVYGNSLYAKCQRIAGKFHVEQRGIERVPEDERTDVGFKSLLNVSTMVRVVATSISEGWLS